MRLGNGRWARKALLVSLLLGSLFDRAGAGDEPKTEPIRVISYNVQFLPGIASIANRRKQPRYRAERLGQLLADYDVVALNEVFEAKPRETILAGLRAAWGPAYQAVAITAPDDGRFNGGLAIATRLVLVESNETLFSQGSSKEKYGVFADGFAAKGVLHARLRRPQDGPETWLDVFCTHLESKDDDVRAVQYRELADFVRQHSSPKNPLLIVGDMNTRGNEDDLANPQSAYHRMLSIYQAGRGEAPLRDAWVVAGEGPGGTGDQEDSEDGGNRIDYQFYSAPLGAEDRFRPQRVIVNRFLDPRTVALSDHNAVEAEYIWQP